MEKNTIKRPLFKKATGLEYLSRLSGNQGIREIYTGGLGWHGERAVIATDGPSLEGNTNSEDFERVMAMVRLGKSINTTNKGKPINPIRTGKTNVWGDNGVLGCLPLHPGLSIDETRRVRRANRYLIAKSTKIDKVLETEGRFNDGIKLWTYELRRSKAYHLVLLHQACPDWYRKYNKEEIKTILKKFRHKMINGHIPSDVTRTYVTEWKRGKWKRRPIGSPNIYTKMMSIALTRMLTKWRKLKGPKTEYQHGYMADKGVWTALRDLRTKLNELEMDEQNAVIYEFDFKGFFNNVRPWGLLRMIEVEGSELADMVREMIIGLKIKDVALAEDESEILRVEMSREGLKVERQGLPQGLSISPLLATLSLATVGPPPEGLIMYADDGMLVMAEEDQVSQSLKNESWFNQLELIGAKREFEKSGFVKESFKFLGFTINLTDQTIEREGVIHSYREEDMEDLQRWVERFDLLYGKSKDLRSLKWDWEIKKDSVATEVLSPPKFSQREYPTLWRIWDKEGLYKNEKRSLSLRRNESDKAWLEKEEWYDLNCEESELYNALWESWGENKIVGNLKWIHNLGEAVNVSILSTRSMELMLSQKWGRNYRKMHRYWRTHNPMISATNTSMHTLGDETRPEELTQALMMKKGDYMDIYVMSANNTRAFIEDNRIERSRDYESIVELIRRVEEPLEEAKVLTKVELNRIKGLLAKIAEKKDRLRSLAGAYASKIENRRVTNWFENHPDILNGSLGNIGAMELFVQNYLRHSSYGWLESDNEGNFPAIDEGNFKEQSANMGIELEDDWDPWLVVNVDPSTCPSEEWPTEPKKAE